MVFEDSLLAKRLQWEKDNPRDPDLRKAEETIVKALVAAGFGRQYQVTDHRRFQISVDNVLITVEQIV